MYLPDIFRNFLESHGEIAEAYQKAGLLCSQAGPIDEKHQHLIQLGVAVGIGSKGGVRSHARRAKEAGASDQEIVQAVLLAAPLVGFPTMMASYGWVKDSLNPGKD
jgi:AhpD family alkylhydroperoxidase